MGAPLELQLTHPVEMDGVTHDKVTVASPDAIANFRTNSAEQVILSLARVFDVPRKIVRHLDPSDAERAGDLVVQLLNDAARSLNPFE